MIIIFKVRFHLNVYKPMEWEIPATDGTLAWTNVGSEWTIRSPRLQVTIPWNLEGRTRIFYQLDWDFKLSCVSRLPISGTGNVKGSVYFVAEFEFKLDRRLTTIERAHSLTHTNGLRFTAPYFCFHWFLCGGRQYLWVWRWYLSGWWWFRRWPRLYSTTVYMIIGSINREEWLLGFE